MRRALNSLRELAATRPRVLPFVPVLAAALFRRGAPEPESLPHVPTSPRPGRPHAPNADADLVVFAIVRNGIANGYPFIEAYGSWLGRADRILIVDGESDDGTREALGELATIDASIVVESAPWPATTTGGSAIAELTNTALARARVAAQRLMYVQADEIYTDTQRDLIVGHRSSTVLEFAGCINFWNSFETVLENEFPMRYARVFPADVDTRSITDGFSFDLNGLDVETTREQFLHYGWCFPVNILRKHVSHGALYRDNPGYRMRGALAKLLLEQRRYDRRLLDALAPQYVPTPFVGEHPACMRHVLGQRLYDPTPGLRLLRSGVRW